MPQDMPLGLWTLESRDVHEEACGVPQKRERGPAERKVVGPRHLIRLLRRRSTRLRIQVQAAGLRLGSARCLRPFPTSTEVAPLRSTHLNDHATRAAVTPVTGDEKRTDALWPLAPSAWRGCAGICCRSAG